MKNNKKHYIVSTTAMRENQRKLLYPVGSTYGTSIEVKTMKKEKELVRAINNRNQLIKNNIIKSFLAAEKSLALRSKSLLSLGALGESERLHNNTKSIVYSFNKINNISPLLTKTEYLLKSIFRSMFSLISKPIYLIKHDKIIIRLFVYLSPKIDKYLDTSSSFSVLDTDKINELNTVNIAKAKDGLKKSIFSGFSANISGLKIGKFLKFKSLRPNVIEIVKSQINFKPIPSVSLKKTLTLAKYPIKASLSLIKIPTFSKAYGLNKEQVLSLSLPSVRISDKANTNNKKVKESYISFVSNFKNNLEKLSLIFGKIFNKKVEFEIIKVQLPFQDSYILAQILGYNANKYKFRQMLKILLPRAVIKNPSNKRFTSNVLSALREKVINNNFLSLMHYPSDISSGKFKDKVKVTSGTRSLDHENISLANLASPITALEEKGENLSYLSGINIKLAGRLMTQSIRPRFTVQSLQEGSLARVKVHFIEKSRFTGKNKRGAFSFTVTISHVFN
jgi:hypothetical protein